MYPKKVWLADTILPLTRQNTRWAIYEHKLEDLGSIRRTMFCIVTHRNLRKKVVLGPYFHRRTIVTISVERGGGVLLTQSLNNAGKPVGEVVTQALRAGDRPINLVPLTAYTFELWPNTYIGSLQTELWPSNDDDRHIYKLV